MKRWIRYWFFVCTGQRRRAGSMKAWQTRKDNDAKKRLSDATEADFNKAFGIVQPPTQADAAAGVICDEAVASPEKAA